MHAGLYKLPGLEPRESWNVQILWSESGYHRRHCTTIRAIRFPKPRLQFAILNPDHERTGDDRESCERKERDQTGSNAPGQNFAQMSEVNRMPHARTNSARHQFLPMLARFEFGQS